MRRLASLALALAVLSAGPSLSQEATCTVSDDPAAPRIDLYDQPGGTVTGHPWPGAMLMSLSGYEKDGVTYTRFAAIRTDPPNEFPQEGYVALSALDCGGKADSAGKLKRNAECKITGAADTFVDYVEAPGGKTLLKVAAGTVLLVSEVVDKDGTLWAAGDAYLDSNTVGFVRDEDLDKCASYE